MRFIKNNWFGLLSGTVVFIFLALFVLVLLSPRQDVKQRGFIPCTEVLASRLSVCLERKEYGCLLQTVFENSWCELKVVGKGLKLWVSGQQPTPWANYIFVPELENQDENFDAEARKEYLENNPGFAEEMQRLKMINEELENEQQEFKLEEEQPK